MSDIIIWENPPAPRNSPEMYGANYAPYYEEVAAELRAHPSRWARIRTSTQAGALSTARRIKLGQINAFAGGGYEVCVRTLDDLSSGVYARWVA